MGIPQVNNFNSGHYLWGGTALVGAAFAISGGVDLLKSSRTTDHSQGVALRKKAMKKLAFGVAAVAIGGGMFYMQPTCPKLELETFFTQSQHPDYFPLFKKCNCSNYLPWENGNFYETEAAEIPDVGDITIEDLPHSSMWGITPLGRPFLVLRHIFNKMEDIKLTIENGVLVSSVRDIGTRIHDIFFLTFSRDCFTYKIRSYKTGMVNDMSFDLYENECLKNNFFRKENLKAIFGNYTQLKDLFQSLID